MTIRAKKRERSGQIIAISALVIALIMTSTAMYVYELSGNIAEADTYVLSDWVHSVELGSKHVVIGALANITNGGHNQTIAVNLNLWRAFVERQISLGTFVLDYTPQGTAPYSDGLYISWGVDGSGVSEACVDLLLNASGREVDMQFPYYVNVSSRLYVEGFLTQVAPGTKQVTVTCRLLNEGQPALAKNLTIRYRESSQWLTPDASNNYALTDYGNGTYRAVFTVEISATSMDVSARVFDERIIFVQANAALTQQ